MLQDAKKLPKWQKKSWQVIFLCFSRHHSTNVSLVLNPETGSITPSIMLFSKKNSQQQQQQTKLRSSNIRGQFMGQRPGQ
jgi:hypothetical protein